MTTCKLWITCSCCSEKVDLMQCINNFRETCYYCGTSIGRAEISLGKINREIDQLIKIADEQISKKPVVA